MPRLIVGLALGTVWALLAGGAVAVVYASATALPTVLAVLLLPGLVGGGGGAWLPPSRLARMPLGAALGAPLAIAVVWGAGFGVSRFLLTHSFDFLGEVAAVFATALTGSAAVALALVLVPARQAPAPAGRAAAVPLLTLSALGTALATRVTARILGFEAITLGGLVLSSALAVPGLALLAPSREGPSRGLATALSGVGVLLLAAGLGLYAVHPAVRAAAWGEIPVTRRLASLLAGATDADGDGISGSFGHPDCDDADGRVFPGTAERPGNGRDDNCLGGDVAVDAVRELWAPGGARARPEAPPELPLDRQRWNVLLLTVDALRADHTSFLGYDRPTTPNLANLAERSLVFEQTWAASNFSSLSLFALFTGLYPSAFLRGERIVAQPDLTLAERLGEAGWTTEAIVDFHPPLRHLYRGFDRVDDSLGARAAKAVRNRSTASTAAELTRLGRSAIDRLAGESSPFLLWVHYSEPHAAYLEHPDHDFGDRPIDRYDGEIAYTDAALGRLLAHLRDQGLLRKTLVVVASDHGEAFGEHGVRTHGESLHAEEIRVPLLLHLPGDRAAPHATRVATPVDLTDVLPTVLDALGQRGGFPTHGESLLPHALTDAPLRTPSVFSETRLPYARLQAWRRGDRKIVADHLVGTYRLYTVGEDGPGPGRTASEDAVDAFADWVDRHLAQPRVRPPSTRSRPASPEGP